jgi:hypothetical protein
MGIVFSTEQTIAHPHPGPPLEREGGFYVLVEIMELD